MTTELAVLLRAGLPLDRSLKVLIDMAVVPSMAALLGDVLKSVKDGKALSVALQPYASLFGRFYLSMVRSGEASGEMSNGAGSPGGAPARRPRPTATAWSRR
jgi:general secretion pathway protein F